MVALQQVGFDLGAPGLPVRVLDDFPQLTVDTHRAREVEHQHDVPRLVSSDGFRLDLKRVDAEYPSEEQVRVLVRGIDFNGRRQMVGLGEHFGFRVPVSRLGFEFFFMLGKPCLQFGFTVLVVQQDLRADRIAQQNIDRGKIRRVDPVDEAAGTGQRRGIHGPIHLTLHAHHVANVDRKRQQGQHDHGQHGCQHQYNTLAIPSLSTRLLGTTVMRQASLNVNHGTTPPSEENKGLRLHEPVGKTSCGRSVNCHRSARHKSYPGIDH